MARVGTLIPARLSRRMCLSCGFDGRALQSGHHESAWVCPRCGSDLYTRPPRSYAELEGLSDSDSPYARVESGGTGTRLWCGVGSQAGPLMKECPRVRSVVFVAACVGIGLALLSAGVFLVTAV